jgi:hypothetical protein
VHQWQPTPERSRELERADEQGHPGGDDVHPQAGGVGNRLAAISPGTSRKPLATRATAYPPMTTANTVMITQPTRRAVG